LHAALTVIQPHAPIITRPAKVRQLASALWQNAQKINTGLRAIVPCIDDTLGDVDRQVEFRA